MPFESDVQRCPEFNGMAQDLFEGEKVLAFDLETTGVSTNNDRIVQYALIGTLADGTAVNVEQLVKPGVRIPFDASNIHGIYDEDVRDKRFSEVADELADLIDGAVLVGHNVRSFDFAMLKTVEFLRMGRLAPQPKAIMDTLNWYGVCDCQGPTTSVRCASDTGFGSRRHTPAAADAAATMLLFWRLSVEHAGAFRRSLGTRTLDCARRSCERRIGNWGADWTIRSPLMRWVRYVKTVENSFWGLRRHRGRYLREVQLSDPPTSGGCCPPGVSTAKKLKSASRRIFVHEDGRS